MKNVGNIRALIASVEAVAFVAKRDAFDAWLEDTEDGELAALREETDKLWQVANHALWHTMPASEVHRRLRIQNR